MDELGRGTSTFDGTAIASACVNHLVQQNRCLTLFATHYHSLLTEFMDEPCVRLGHMQCHVEGGVEEEPTKEPSNEEHNITFLYTLADGACPASFGINVAKLAGLPNQVLASAKGKSTAFEQEMSATDNGPGCVREIVAAIEADDIARVGEVWQSLQQAEL